MALAADILDQDDLTGADLACLAVACGDLHPGVEVDDVLPARRRMPIQVIAAGGFAENDPGGGQPGGQLAAVAFLDPFDLDVAPMGLAGIIDVDVVNAHGCLRYSIGTKIECRIWLLTDLDRWPLPVTSSTRMISPAPITRDSPSLAVSSTPASRLMMYCRRGAGCQGRSCSACVWRKMMPVAA